MHIIRPAISQDAAAIAQVHIASWQATYRGHIADEVLNSLSLPTRTTEWQQRLQAGVRVWVCECNDKLVGFVSVCPTRDKDDDPTQVIEMSAIYLLPEFWRKGLGKELVQAALHHAIQMGFQEMTLWVLESNQQARHFYENLGFYATGDVDMDHIGCESLRVVRYRKKLQATNG